jgi:hypothetical protein
MARKKLKVKKFRGGGGYQGGRKDVAPGAAKAGPVERPGNYQEKQITGPIDPGIATESITNFGDNLKARQKAMGFANVIPGAQIVNVAGAIKDTAVGRKAMGMPLISGTQQTLKQMSGQGGDNAITCPPGYVNVGGQCVKKSSKGGSVNYYKGLL